MLTNAKPDSVDPAAHSDRAAVYSDPTTSEVGVKNEIRSADSTWPPDSPRIVRHGRWGLLAVLVLGIGIRVWLILVMPPGHESDRRLFMDWSEGLAVHGLGGFFAATPFCDYPPLMLLIFWGIGTVAAQVSGAADFEYFLARLLQLPASFADLGIALILFFLARRYLSPRLGVAAAALFFLNPVSFYDSAYWGQVDSCHAFFALSAIALMLRNRPGWAGSAMMTALLLKFQSITFVPLFLLESYRRGRWKSAGISVFCGAVVMVLVLSPFSYFGVLKESLLRSYVNVIGQYQELSCNAHNLWYFIAPKNTPDPSIPLAIARIVAEGRTGFTESDSWMTFLTWRHISLIVYALGVAVILSVYSFKPGPVRCFGAAGLLGLCFFLFPTEMHERYAVPAFAFLPIWAVTGTWRERLFFLLSAAMLLNLSAVLISEPMALQIAAMNLFAFAALLVGMAFSESGKRDSASTTIPDSFDADDVQLPDAKLIQWFRRVTGVAVTACIVVGGFTAYRACIAPETIHEKNVLYLSDTTPTLAEQEWKSLTNDQSIEGGLFHLESTYYLRGVGTHAPSRHAYEIPADAEFFEAVAGVNRYCHPRGSATVIVKLDGKKAFESEKLIPRGKSARIRLPVSGHRELTIESTPTRDGARGDHVDWALARFTLRDGTNSEP